MTIILDMLTILIAVVSEIAADQVIRSGIFVLVLFLVGPGRVRNFHDNEIAKGKTP